VDNAAPIIAIFGTRPEVIKLTPVLRALEHDARIRVITLTTGQQADLIPTFLESFRLKIDHELDVMRADQPLNTLLAGVLASVDPVIERHAPRAVLVQGDTTSALGGALAARFRGVPVIHVEAGLRTGDFNSPFPEESNRTLISHIASLHCAATLGNAQTLISEGVPEANIVLTGNPIVDAVLALVEIHRPSAMLEPVMARLKGLKMVVLTAHRRENFGDRLAGYLTVIKEFVLQNSATALVFPVHPNPAVQKAARDILADTPRVFLIEPLGYPDFVLLLKRAWLVLSDSGGVQEEVASLGKPLLVLRNKTERPEAIDSGLARLADSPDRLAGELAIASRDGSWCTRAAPIANPFGDGHSGPRIAEAVADFVFGRSDAAHKRPA
jgi:UDP-N-acetylglucosamine 2-epimerase (non-hydrolysing)